MILLAQKMGFARQLEVSLKAVYLLSYLQRLTCLIFDLEAWPSMRKKNLLEMFW